MFSFPPSWPRSEASFRQNLSFSQKNFGGKHSTEEDPSLEGSIFYQLSDLNPVQLDGKCECYLCAMPSPYPFCLTESDIESLDCSDSVNTFDPSEFPSLGSREATTPNSSSLSRSNYGKILFVFISWLFGLFVKRLYYFGAPSQPCPSIG